MPRSRSNSHHRRSKVPIRYIDGEHTTEIEDRADPTNRNYIIVKFSMIKTLRDGEKEFMLQGNTPNLGNWRGGVKTVECPKDSGHHVAYAALPKDIELQYRWVLLGDSNHSVVEREEQRQITLGREDVTVQDCFGNYSSLLPQIFQPDSNSKDDTLTPIAFVTRHEVQDSSVEAVAIIGSTPELGRWRAKNARVMYEVQPGVWETVLYLSKSLRFKYKFVVVEKSKSKRIKYGERVEHRVHLKVQGDEESISVSEENIITGDIAWAPAMQSEVSIEHVEEQSMGSVASEVSLGTRISLGSYLSDLIETAHEMNLDALDDSIEVNKRIEQENILEELKGELYNPKDFIDLNIDTTEIAPLLPTDSDEQLVVSAESQLPTMTQDRHTMCSQWLAENVVETKSIPEQPDLLNIVETAVVHTVEKPMVEVVEANVVQLEEIVLLQAANNSKTVEPETATRELEGERKDTNETNTKPVEAEKNKRCALRTNISCTSLKTSTTKLPCYFTGDLSSFQTARKIAKKLPWILDLPGGLMTKVLHTLGILSKHKQESIAIELNKPKDELLRDDHEAPTRSSAGRYSATSNGLSNTEKKQS